MEWNNGKERALFEKEQAELRKEYLAAGMTEEQIWNLRVFDEEWYNSRRREAEHTQRLDIETGEDENANMDNPLYKKFFDQLAVEDNHADYSRYGWIEDIEDENLYKAIQSLSDKDKEILTLLIHDGFNVTQAAVQMGVSHQAVSKKIKKFQKIFEEWLRKCPFRRLPIEEG